MYIQRKMTVSSAGGSEHASEDPEAMSVKRFSTLSARLAETSNGGVSVRSGDR